MPTDKPRITITMTEDQFRKVEEYRFGNKMKNQTQAILSLIAMGFAELARQNGEEKEIAPEPDKPDFEAMKEEQMRIIKAVLANIGYSGDLTDNDLLFLQGIVIAVEAHFKERNESPK